MNTMNLGNDLEQIMMREQEILLKHQSEFKKIAPKNRPFVSSNPELRGMIAHMLDELAVYYRTKLSALQKSMYIDDLEEMNLFELGRAIRLYRQDWNSTQFPLPSQLRKIVCFISPQDSK